MQAAEELGSTLATIGRSSAQKKDRKNQLYYCYSRTGLATHQWNLVYHTGSSVGSATTVVSVDIRLQNVGVVVKHHAPTNAHHTNR